jgi:hypothetical protein
MVECTTIDVSERRMIKPHDGSIVYIPSQSNASVQEESWRQTEMNDTGCTVLHLLFADTGVFICLYVAEGAAISKAAHGQNG